MASEVERRIPAADYERRTSSTNSSDAARARALHVPVYPLKSRKRASEREDAFHRDRLPWEDSPPSVDSRHSNASHHAHRQRPPPTAKPVVVIETPSPTAKPTEEESLNGGGRVGASLTALALVLGAIATLA